MNKNLLNTGCPNSPFRGQGGQIEEPEVKKIAESYTIITVYAILLKYCKSENEN